LYDYAITDGAVRLMVSIEKEHDANTVNENEVLFVHYETACIVPVIVTVYVPTYRFDVVYQATTLVLRVNVIKDTERPDVVGVTAIE
jgi:hypothetical protein